LRGPSRYGAERIRADTHILAGFLGYVLAISAAVPIIAVPSGYRYYAGGAAGLFDVPFQFLFDRPDQPRVALSLWPGTPGLIDAISRPPAPLAQP
jgi:hypothetical protein